MDGTTALEDDCFDDELGSCLDIPNSPRLAALLMLAAVVLFDIGVLQFVHVTSVEVSRIVDGIVVTSCDGFPLCGVMIVVTGWLRISVWTLQLI